MLAATQAMSIGLLLPELLLTVGGCVALLLGIAARELVQRLVPWVALVAILAAIAVIRVPLLWAGDAPAAVVVAGGFRFDALADFVRIGALTLGLLITLVAWHTPRDSERGEFFSMLLFSVAGLMLTGAAADLVNLFLAIELVSIPTYVMVTLSRSSPRALEAGTKYFYLGAMAAAITAFGFSYLYGAAGTATIDALAADRVAAALSSPHASASLAAVATIGAVLSIAGLLFKLSAVPLHAYVADVYEGAASPVAGMLGFVPKLAGVVAIVKVLFLCGWLTTDGGLFWTMWWVAALSMTVGNVLALRQTNVKRMLAYSGVAHSGYMLVGLLAAPSGAGVMSDGPAAALFYVFIYGIANLAAFALLELLEVRGQPCQTVRDLAGLVRRVPGLAVLMALAMFTLMGMPPTPGFWGKLSLFGSALSTVPLAPSGNQPWIVALVVIAGLNSALAAAYYLRVIAAVLLYESDEAPRPAARESQHLGVVLCGFLLLIFAFWPRPLLHVGKNASDALNDARYSQASPPPLEPYEELAASPP